MTVPKTPTTEVLSRCADLVTPALRAAVHTLREPLRRIAGYHFGWWDEHGRRATADAGKLLRPALALLSADAVGDGAAAVPAAVAVELAHNFSLLHDDIMDGDTTRRHRPTAWHVFGVNAAILAGDALLTLAFDVLAGSGHPAAREAVRSLGTAVQDLIRGQSEDTAFERRTDVSRAECVRMAEAKTGALLGCCCGLGALLGGGDTDQVDHLTRFGERLGLAFQFVDDLLGIWGDPLVTGKPGYSDLRSRKKSLPVVAALTSGTAAATALAAHYRDTAPLSPGELRTMARLIDEAGSRDWSATRARELRAEALRHLAAARPGPRAEAELTGLAELITSRDH